MFETIGKIERPSDPHERLQDTAIVDLADYNRKQYTCKGALDLLKKAKSKQCKEEARREGVPYSGGISPTSSMQRRAPLIISIMTARYSMNQSNTNDTM